MGDKSINRLLYTVGYLCGPMDKNREDGKLWREDMDEWLESRGVIVLNPYDKPLLKEEAENLGLEHDDAFEQIKNSLAEKAYHTTKRLFKPVRHIDLRCVDKADFIVCYLDLDKNPCGTYEELFWANRAKKPIIICCPQGKQAIPPWMFGTTDHEMMFSDMDEVKEYLDYIDSAKDIERYGRWIFFDFAPIIDRIHGQLNKCGNIDCPHDNMRY